MRVLMLFGQYRGQVRDLLPDAARAMLADGRAMPLPPDGAADVARPPVAVATDRMADADERDPVSRRERRGRRR